MGRILGAVLLALALITGCGDGSKPGQREGYAEEVEAIVETSVTPAAVAASDGLVNLLQGAQVARVDEDIRRAARSLERAEADLRNLEAPAVASASAMELAKLIGELVDYLGTLRGAELERATTGHVDAVGAYGRGIDSLAQAVAALASTAEG